MDTKSLWLFGPFSSALERGGTVVIDAIGGVIKPGKVDKYGNKITDDIVIPDYFGDREDHDGLYCVLEKVDALFRSGEYAVGVVMSHVAIEVATRICMEYLLEKYSSPALNTILRKELNLNLNLSIHPGHPKIIRILNLFLEREDLFSKDELRNMNFHTTVRNNFCHRAKEPTKEDAQKCKDISKALIGKLWLIHRARDNPKYQQP